MTAQVETAASKAILLRALQERVNALEQQKLANAAKRTNTLTPVNQGTKPSYTHVPSTSTAVPTPAPAPLASSTSSSSSTVPRSASLEEMKALLAAKLAAKGKQLLTSTTTTTTSTVTSMELDERKEGPTTTSTTSTTLSAKARPFVPTSTTSTSTTTPSTAASSTTTTTVSDATKANLAKPQLCRSWLTCTFGGRCRFRHPTNISTEPFFDYGGRILLHLNAPALLAALQTNMNDPSSVAMTSTSMSPVLLLILAILVQGRPTGSTIPPSMPLTQLWSLLREQLINSRDLPTSQDDLLNTLGLPTTAAILLRSAEGQPVMSTEAFRNQYACVFVVTRRDGTFHISHEWDELKRARLQVAAEACEAIRPTGPGSKKSKPHPSTTAGTTTNKNASSSSSMTDDPDSDPTRKRKRIPDSELMTGVSGERAMKLSRLGQEYPEDQPISITASSSAVSSVTATMAPGSIYSMNAGAELGGTTSFIRGGIVTELSLLAPSSTRHQHALQQQQLADQQAAAAANDPYEDDFTRAIRRQREVSTQATYTIATKKISSGKGFDMLRMMNWRAGQGLGKRQQGKLEPLEVKFRADRTGL